MVIYVVAILNSPPKKIRAIFQQVKSKQKHKVMSTLEMILKEGEEIGLKKGEETWNEKRSNY